MLRPKEKTLYIAWVGDSQALIANQGRVMQCVEPHKPCREVMVSFPFLEVLSILFVFFFRMKKNALNKKAVWLFFGVRGE